MKHRVSPRFDTPYPFFYQGKILVFNIFLKFIHRLAYIFQTLKCPVQGLGNPSFEIRLATMTNTFEKSINDTTEVLAILKLGPYDGFL